MCYTSRDYDYKSGFLIGKHFIVVIQTRDFTPGIHSPIFLFGYESLNRVWSNGVLSLNQGGEINDFCLELNRVGV